jgi:plasmid replication initiation protein
MASQVVVKSNDLIRASYRLSLMEQRLVLLAITQIHRIKKVDHITLHRIEIGDVAEFIGQPSDNLYAEIKAAANMLENRKFSTILSDGKLFRGRWVDGARYLDNEGAVELSFSQAVMPYLTELKTKFTSYLAKDVARLTSVYAVRIFELMMQWKAAGVFEIEVAELRRILELQDSYPYMAKFRRDVVEVATKQISKHTPYKLSYQAHKTGRNITSFSFKFGLKAAANKPKAKPKPGKAATNGPSRRAQEMAEEARKLVKS